MSYHNGPDQKSVCFTEVEKDRKPPGVWSQIAVSVSSSCSVQIHHTDTIHNVSISFHAFPERMYIDARDFLTYLNFQRPSIKFLFLVNPALHCLFGLLCVRWRSKCGIVLMRVLSQFQFLPSFTPTISTFYCSHSSKILKSFHSFIIVQFCTFLQVLKLSKDQLFLRKCDQVQPQLHFISMDNFESRIWPAKPGVKTMSANDRIWDKIKSEEEWSLLVKM